MSRVAGTGVHLPAARLRPELAAYFTSQRLQTPLSHCGVLAELAEQGAIRRQEPRQVPQARRIHCGVLAELAEQGRIR